jgi:hypothetical protein
MRMCDTTGPNAAAARIGGRGGGSEDCFGLDQSQVRLSYAIARHTVLVLRSRSAPSPPPYCAGAPTPRRHHRCGPISRPSLTWG